MESENTILGYPAGKESFKVEEPCRIKDFCDSTDVVFMVQFDRNSPKAAAKRVDFASITIAGTKDMP